MLTPLDNQELDKELKRITNNLYVDGLEAHLPASKRRDLGSSSDPIGDTQEALRRLLLSEAHRIGMEAIGEDGKVHGHMRPQGYPSIDLTESYRNDLRKEQRQKLSELTGVSDE